MNDTKEKQQNLHVRMDADVKQQFAAILEQMGLNPSIAVNIFARLVIQEKALPFNVALKNSNQVVIDEDGEETEENNNQETKEIKQEPITGKAKIRYRF